MILHKNFQKRVLFVGMPDMAIVCFEHLYKAGVNLVGAVPPDSNNPSYECFVSFMSNFEVPVINYENSLKDAQFLEQIKRLNADIAVVCSYNKLFPREFLSCTKDGFINCHPSLLPDYRGANPYSHVIINDEKVSGVTLHFMDESFDTGDIICQKKLSLSGNETMGILFNVCNYIAADLLLQVLTRYEETNTLPRKSQNKNSDKIAPAINQNGQDNRIDWSKTAKEIECFVRALNPFIVAVTGFRNEFVRVMNVNFEKKRHNLTPGTVCDTRKGLGVATVDGVVYINILQYGTFLICSGKELVAKMNIKNGEMFY